MASSSHREGERERHGRRLNAYARVHDSGREWLSPLDVVLDEARALVVQPDLMFISKERESIVHDHVDGEPDLVVEVLSPNPRIGKTEERVRECWLVHLDRRDVTVITCANSRIRARRVSEPAIPRFPVP